MHGLLRSGARRASVEHRTHRQTFRSGSFERQERAPSVVAWRFGLASWCWRRGNGSNLQAILDACAAGDLPADVVAVVSDQCGASALERAALAGVPSVHIGRLDGEARADYDARLADLVAGFAPDIVVLAGWMRILTNSFLGWYPNKVINLHPARPGELPGTRAIERAWQEALAGERTVTGVMVHLVPDEGVDDGPVLATEDVEILPDDTLASLEARIHAVEHRLLVATIRTRCHQLTTNDTEIHA